VARPLLAVALAVLVLGACSGGDRPTTASEDGTTTTARAGDEALAPALSEFLERAEASEDAPFRATWDVLRKLEGVQSSATVVAGAGGARITVGDLVVVLGERPATCRTSARSCVGEVREEQLAPFGIFSRFWSTGPADALRAVVRRDDDGPPVPSARTSAGVRLECVAVPVGSSLPATACITPEGVFGFVDNPAVRYELTDYQPGPVDPADLEVPFPVTDDDTFLGAA
jgi:hypothetical protein